MEAIEQKREFKMNRVPYILTVLMLIVVIPFALTIAANGTVWNILSLQLMTVAGTVVAACARWNSIGHHPAWGVLSLVPFVWLYGAFAPPDSIANGKARTTALNILVIVGILLFLLIAIPAYNAYMAAI